MLTSVTHNGETSREESSWTGRCVCGWSESCRRKADVLAEYSEHLRRKREGLHLQGD